MAEARRRLIDVPDLERQRLRIFQVAFDHYLATETWPTVATIARNLVEEMDVDEALQGLTWPWIDTNHASSESPLPLRLLAVSRCANATELLDSFVAALRLAAGKYFDRTSSPELTQEMLVKELGLSNRNAHHALVFLDNERLSRNKSGNAPGNWVLHFDGAIRKFRNLQSIEDYLALSGAAKQALEKPLGSREEYVDPAAAQDSRQRYIPKTAFVMMWLSPENPQRNEVAAVIRDVFAAYGIKAEHAMDVDHDGVITDMILAKIRDAEFLVGDLTGERPSVYYEIGYAHALGRHPMLMRRKDTHIHFDLSVHNAPEYTDLEDLRRMLLRRLNERIGPPPKAPD